MVARNPACEKVSPKVMGCFYIPFFLMIDSPIGKYYQHVNSCVVYRVKDYATLISLEHNSLTCVICELVSSKSTIVIPTKEFFSRHYQLIDPSTLSFNRPKVNHV